ncbi:hypothetical protein CYY_006394 [Polysphondylium violaceum]|uniref:Ankyrin repeat-containing protein n=1 Tax=Polysphondylium violaceum TaxID=133409 RepID=A0A8J4V367_9MYCE|nr:hypothetical protein CYY_006394 [Polysphondylium violaceum]
MEIHPSIMTDHNSSINSNSRVGVTTTAAAVSKGITAINNQLSNNTNQLAALYLQNYRQHYLPYHHHYHQEDQDTSNEYILTINDLSAEVLINIFKYLSPFDLRIIAPVCKYWSFLSEENCLWQEKCISQWSWMFDVLNEKVKYKANSSWKEFYKFWAVEYLKHSEWYQYSLSRDQANSALKYLGKGTYLVRSSGSKPNSLVISYNVHSKDPHHLLISNLGSYIGVFLNDEIGTIYPTLASLIKDKKRFLKRPMKQSKLFESKSTTKRNYILKMISDPKSRNGKSLNQLKLLHIACKWCFKDLVQNLLSIAGVDINFRESKKGKTPLHFAVGFVHGEPSSNQRTEIVQYLLMSGSDDQKGDCNVLDFKGRSPLHIAVKQHQPDSPDLVEILLSCGADPSIYNHKGLYPLHISVKENNLRTVKSLLKHERVDVNCKIESTKYSKLDNSFLDTPLHISSQNSFHPIIKLLLQCKDININERDYMNRTCLHRAVLNTQDWLSITRFGKPLRSYFAHQTLELLLKSNADPSLLDNENKTALHISASKGHRKSTFILVRMIKGLKLSDLDIFKKEDLLDSIEIGKHSKDVEKIINDLKYSMFCGFDQTELESVQKTINDHYKNISDIIHQHL